MGCTRQSPPQQSPAPPAPVAEAPSPAPNPPPEPAPAPAEVVRPQFRPGTAVSVEQLPNELRKDSFGWRSASPDGKWGAVLLPGRWPHTQELWLLSDAGDRAWYVAPEIHQLSEPVVRWSAQGTLLYYVRYGQPWQDTWLEFQPETGQIAPFMPEIFSGRVATHWVPSPDGSRILVETDRCDGCNKPSTRPTTTYVVDLMARTWQEIGVDVEAQWAGNEVKAVARAPEMGYSGNHPVIPEHPTWPLSLAIQVGGTDYGEWRVYRAQAAPGEAPLQIFPALNQESNYHMWQLWWPEPPAEPVRLEFWAEVRPAVADPVLTPDGGRADFRQEGGKRWAVVYSGEVTPPVEGNAERQTLLLRSAKMWSPTEGWGVDWAGRILRTGDGGATWWDVTPGAMQRCTGRLYRRQAEYFDNNTAAVALGCDSTGPDGRWTSDSSHLTLLCSVDGGQTWAASEVKAPYAFARPAALTFVDEQTGWALVQPKYPEVTNRGSLYQTRDGGRSWQMVSDADSGLPAALEVQFADQLHGWAVGPGRVGLWRTEDGGRTWSPATVDLPEGDQVWVWAPTFLNPAEGYFTAAGVRTEGMRLGSRVLYWTSDGGRTWEKRSEWDGERRPAFLSPKVAYIGEYELRTLNWTRDGGRTWEPVPWEIDLSALASVQFLDERTGFAVQGKLWVTTDGGRSWTEIRPNWASSADVASES